MPTTENDRRNRQEPVLENPSLPDHDRTLDEGMHAALPTTDLDTDAHSDAQMGSGSLDESETAPPDQVFGQILASGPKANEGRIPDDPNNWLTSDHDRNDIEEDPENRGVSLPDLEENAPR